MSWTFWILYYEILAPVKSSLLAAILLRRYNRGLSECVFLPTVPHPHYLSKSETLSHIILLHSSRVTVQLSSQSWWHISGESGTQIMSSYCLGHVSPMPCWTLLPLEEGRTGERSGTSLFCCRMDMDTQLPAHTEAGGTGVLTAPLHTTVTSLTDFTGDPTSNGGGWRWAKPQCQVALLHLISFSLIAVASVQGVEVQLHTGVAERRVLTTLNLNGPT